MERLRLDYQRQETPLPRPGLLVLMFAVTTMFAVGDDFASLTNLIDRWNAYAEQIESAARQSGVIVHKDQRGNAADSEDIRHANAVLRQVTLPWGKLFDTIESIGNKDVALLALTPDPEKRLVRIGIEAKNASAGLEYVQRLGSQEIFQNVQLQSHQIQLQDPEKPIRFTLQATWKGLP
ncbi:MAG TPA: hypothetical protein VFF82_02940 [Rhodocyclaceae bacterium]|nr:hypothetical protein [Rhodocyclaceae bacterium]